MAIIVAGKLTIKSGARDEFIKQSREAILRARKKKLAKIFRYHQTLLI